MKAKYQPAESLGSYDNLAVAKAYREQVEIDCKATECRARADAARVLRNARSKAQEISAKSKANITQEVLAIQEAHAEALARGLGADLIRLSFKFAEKVLKHSVTHDSRFMEQEISKALSDTQGETNIELRVSPSDNDAAHQAISKSCRAPHIKLVKESTIEPGNATLRGNFGEISISWNRALKRLESESVLVEEAIRARLKNALTESVSEILTADYISRASRSAECSLNKRNIKRVA